MAKKGKGRSRYQAIPFGSGLTLGTLGNGTVLTSQALDAAMAENYFCTSVDLQYSIFGATPTEGPIEVGINHDDYSVTEIAEALDAEVVDPGNKIAMERARRLVHSHAKFPVALANESLNNGLEKRYTVKWMIQQGHQLGVWARNKSGTALTTGAIISITGVMHGYWRY